MNRVTLFGGLLLAGCGAGSNVDVEAYRAANREVAASVQLHRDRSRTATTTQDCADEQRRYDADVRPKVERVRTLSDGMDGCMRSSGRPEWADMGRMCDSMMGELDRYGSSACGSSDQGANRTDANRHCDVMDGYTARENERADNAGQCGAANGGGMMGGGGMM
ncbi:MAG: hypothetical protein HY904_14510 [Deltaproteobacteria bacterium]|nr:hypothetical protein [Deltaproteobacteria bacterium]